MPLQLPNLDDRTYANLVEEALALIPAHAPEWTNHNPTDPGVTLIELFAYLSEMLLYRQNRVTDANQQAFLRLLRGGDPDWKYDPSTTLRQNIQSAVLTLRDEQRAVTAEDFERLARRAISVGRVMRAHCLPRRNLESGGPDAATKEAPGHVSIVIVPAEPASQGNRPLRPDSVLLEDVRQFLQPRCLITTRLHVVGPGYLKIRVRITLHLNADAREDDVRSAAIKALKTFLDPLLGGTEQAGWPLGRNVYVSDIYALLDKLPGVDYVAKTQEGDTAVDELAADLAGPSRRILSGDKGPLVGLRLEPHELVELQIEEKDIACVWTARRSEGR